jgi:hypothetical protein
MIKISNILQEDSSNFSTMVAQQKEMFRTQLRTALAADGGLIDGEVGVEVQTLLDLWMEDPRSLLDADDLEFILDDETLFNDDQF